MSYPTDTSTQLNNALTPYDNYSSVTTPNINFNSTSGIYNPSANVIKIFTNNTDALTIDASQNITGNGSGLININYNNLTNKPTNFQTDWNTTVLNRPTLFSGAYTDLLGKPTNFQTDWNTTVLNRPTLFSGAYTDLSGKPSLFSGVYTDLSSKPDLSVYASTSALNSLSTNSILSINNLNATSTTLFTNLNSLSTNSTLSINNMNATSTTLLTNLNSLSANSTLSINNLNATSTTILGLVNGHTTSISNLTATSTTLFTNLNSLSTNSILSINNMNATSTTLFTNLNSLSTNSTLSINNMNATSTTLFTNLNSLSTNSTLSINNLNATSTTILGLVNGHTTSISNLTATSTTLFTNLNSLSTNSILSINNINATSTTLFTNLNSLSTNSTLSINNINATSTTILGLVNGHTTSINNINATSTTLFTNLNSLSTNSTLSINNINATSTTLFTNLNSLSTSSVLSINNLNTTSTTILGLVNGNTTSINNINASTTTLFTTKQNNLTFSNPFLNTTNTISLKYDSAKLNIDASGNLTVIGAGQWTTTGTSIFYNGGNVGIGTGNPLSLLDINTASYTGPLLTLDAGIGGATGTQLPRAIGQPLIKLGKTSYSSTVGDYYGIGFGYSPALADKQCCEIGCVITDKSVNETGDLIFSTRLGNTNISATEKMRIKNNGNVSILSTDNFNINFSTANSSWANFTLNPTSLWGDGLTTASDQAGTKYLTARQLMFQSPHVVPNSVGGDAFIRLGRAGGIQSGTWWELATKTNGNFNIGKEASTTTGLNIDTSGNLTVSGSINSSSGESTFKYIRIINPDGRNTHFSYTGNGENYIRGKLNVDGDNIYCGGYIGVGGNPYYPLDIYHYGPNAYVPNGLIYQTATYLATQTSTQTTSIRTYGAIWTLSYFMYSSDIRIKKNIRDINDDIALQKILAIQPKYYNYIDITKQGDKDVIGFIAQQVEEVEPLAVSTQNSFIPNIFKSVDIIDDKFYLENNNLNINDEIEIWDLDGNKKPYKIINVNGDEITINEKVKGEKCLIYGVKVNDFKTLNKDYIFTLNVGATQELYKLIKQQNLIIQDLQDRISILENK